MVRDTHRAVDSSQLEWVYSATPLAKETESLGMLGLHGAVNVHLARLHRLDSAFDLAEERLQPAESLESKRKKQMILEEQARYLQNIAEHRAILAAYTLLQD